MRKPLRKNIYGLKRACRRTFRKLFGEKTKKDRKTNNSAKFITDMMSESSESEGAGSD